MDYRLRLAGWSALTVIASSLLTHSLICVALSTAYVVSVYRIREGRISRLRRGRTLGLPTDDYTRVQLATPMAFRERAYRFIDDLASIPFAPALLLRSKFSELFAAPVPTEYYLTVGVVRNGMRASFPMDWCMYLTWVYTIGILWAYFIESREFIAIIIFLCYAGLCAKVVAYSISPRSVAKQLKLSAARSPKLRYLATVPIIAIALWSCAFLVGLTTGLRNADIGDAQSLLRDFVGYRYLVKFTDYSGSPAATDPSVLITYIPALCFFSLVLPLACRPREFMRDAQDRLDQAECALYALDPFFAQRVLEIESPLGRSDLQCELKAVAFIQQANYTAAAGCISEHAMYSNGSIFGMSDGTVALAIAARFPTASPVYTIVVREWLNLSPTPMEQLYVVLNQSLTSRTCFEILHREISATPGASYQSHAVVNWLFANPDFPMIPGLTAPTVYRRMGWLAESLPLPVQMAGDLAYVTAQRDEKRRRRVGEVWCKRLKRWSRRFRQTNDGLVAVEGIVLGATALLVLGPCQAANNLYESMADVEQRLREKELLVPPPFQSSSFSQLLQDAEARLSNA